MSQQSLVKLIETFGEFVGLERDPKRLEKKLQVEIKAITGRAQAEADASLIKVKAEIEAERLIALEQIRTQKLLELAKSSDNKAPVEMRLERRKIFQELREQNNLDNIFLQTAYELPSEVSEVPVDEDWVASFVDTVKNVSNEQMQSLWSKILAGEITKPGSFSLRTLQFVKTMSQEEAELFTKFCNYIWHVDPSNRNYFHIYTDEAKSHLATIGLRHIDYIGLESLGLLTRESSLSIHKFADDKEGSLIRLYYGKKSYIFKQNDETKAASMPIYKLTVVGDELARLQLLFPDKVYISKLTDSLQKLNINLIDVFPEQNL